MGRRPSIRVWLLVFAFASAIPLTAFACWLVIANHLAARTAALQQVQQTARALAQAMDRQLRAFESITVAQASSDSLRRDALEEFYSETQRIVEREKGVIAFILHDLSGQQLVNTMRPYGEKLPSRRDTESISAVLKSRAPRITDLYTETLLGRPAVGVDAPVLVQGEMKYVLTVSLSLDAMNELLRNQKLPPGWLAGLFDRKGILVGRSRAADRYIGRPGAPLLLEGIRNAPEGSVETPTLEGDVVISTWSRLADSGWSAAIAIPKNELSAQLWSDLAIVIAAGLIVLAIGAGAAIVSAGMLARQISAIAHQAEALGKGETVSRRRFGVRELDDLASALTGAGDLLHAREQQRDAAELRRRVLSAELDHRVKNILAVAQALARQTLGRSEPTDAYLGRLQALASSHAALAETAWSGADFRRLIAVAIEPFCRKDDGRITTEGPDAKLKPRAAQSLALILHELGTNAVKYGALSAGGNITLKWWLSGNGDRITVEWRECGGPAIHTAPKRGFGTSLIERLTTYDLGGAADFDYRPEGLVCTIDAALVESAVAPNPTDTAAPRKARDGVLSGKRVMIVEDVALTAMAMEQTVLEAGGEPVGPFSSIREAARALDREIIHAALLDVNVNGELVFPLAQRLKELNVSVLFVTGYSESHLWPAEWKNAPRLVKPAGVRELTEVWLAHFKV